MTQPIIVFGDTHGLTVWKQIIKENPECRYIFLGDYLDPFEPIEKEKLLQNLQEIIDLKKQQPLNVTLLLGNHDMHYITSDMEPCLRFDVEIYEAANKIFTDNFDMFQYSYQEGKYIFTHAGISQEWFTKVFRGILNDNISEQLNNPTDEQVSALCQISELFGGNKGNLGSIFWTHLQELYEPLKGYTQIVGHNSVEEVSEYKTETATASVIFCDCLWNGKYLRIEREEMKVMGV